jgi:hypothetical protein
MYPSAASENSRFFGGDIEGGLHYVDTMYLGMIIGCCFGPHTIQNLPDESSAQ